MISFSKDRYLPLLVLPVRETPERTGEYTAADMAAAHAALIAAEHHMGTPVRAWVGNYTGTAAAATLADGSRLRWDSEADHGPFEHVIECSGGTTHRVHVNGPFDIARHRTAAAACPDHPAPAKPRARIFTAFANAVNGRRTAGSETRHA